MPGPTAYFIFCQEQRDDEKARLLSEGREKVSVADVAKALGEKWKALSDEEKGKYREQAKAAAELAAKNQPQDGTEEVAANEPKPAKADHLPISTVRKVILSDAEIQRASHDALVVIGLAAERFLGLLASKGLACAKAQKRRTLKLDDFANSARSDRRLTNMGLQDVTALVAKQSAAVSAEQDKAGKTGAAEGKAKDAPNAAATNKQHNITSFFTKPAAVGAV